MTDPYSVLGVPQDAPYDDIHRAYLRLARNAHPDVRGGDLAAAERMSRINQAWDLLSDAEARAAFDLRGQCTANDGRDSGSDRRGVNAGRRGGGSDRRGVNAGSRGGGSDRRGVNVYGVYGQGGVVGRQAWPESESRSDAAFCFIDASDADDRPITAGRLPEWLRLGAPASCTAGVLVLILGLVMGLVPVMVFGLFMLMGSGLLFVLAPFAVLVSSRNACSDRHGDRA